MTPTTELENETTTEAGGEPSRRERVASAYEAARERAGAAAETLRGRAADAGRRTANTVESSPMAVVVGGLALGAVFAALLPRTERENRALGGLGNRLTGTARDAVRAARDAGKGTLDEIGYNTDNAKQKLSDIATNAAKAFGSSATAAARTVKGSGKRK